jgi:hypothetical protein
VSATIAPVIRLPIHLPIRMSIHLPIHLSILLSVGLAVLLPVGLPILLPVSLPIRLPIGLAIFLSDIQLGEYHIWQDGRSYHGHDQARNRSNFHKILLHDTFSFDMREWVISVDNVCCWMVPSRLSHLVTPPINLLLIKTMG